MFPPITNVLIKLFAFGFYRVHAGFLLVLTGVIFSHFFWMEPLGGHLTHDQSVFWHLILMISLVDNPMFMILIFAVWFIYTAKSWDYIFDQLFLAENTFLLYSFASTRKVDQFKSWFLVQSIIGLPAILFGLTSIVIGLLYNYYLLSGIIFLYLVLLTSISAIIYIFWIKYHINSEERKPFFFRITDGWKKPFPILFVFYVFDKLKITFLLTKLLTFFTVLVHNHLLPDFKEDVRLAGIVLLLITIIHSVLIFYNQRFEKIYLSFSRNFPFSRLKLYLYFIIVYLLLTLPECIWIFSQYDPVFAIGLILFGLSIALLWRSLIYLYGLRMDKFLPGVFYLSVLFFMIIMFGYLWVLPPLCIVLSFYIFYKNYYRINI